MADAGRERRGTGAATPPPFRLRDAALITLASGKIARDLAQLRERIAEAAPASLRHHFFEVLLRPSFDDPEVRNDFAVWARDALRDDALAERLAVIDPFALARDDEALRGALLVVLEQRLAEIPPAAAAPPAREFHFLHSQLVVFDTGIVAASPEDLARRVADLPRGGVFYHFVDARLRRPAGEDDFSAWLATWGERGEGPRRRLAAVDPLFGSLTELRDSIVTALTSTTDRRP